MHGRTLPNTDSPNTNGYMESVVQSERTVLCDRCGRFLSKGSFKAHHDRHNGTKKYKCDFCDKSFFLKNDLERHHLVHSGDKPFSCDLCGNGFGQRYDLHRHKMNVHKQKPVVCDICNKNFKAEESLQNHKETMHKMRPQEQYVCKVCGRIYLNRRSLASHRRLKHKPEMLLSCPTCEKKVLHPSDLKRHMAQHEGIKINSDKPTVHQCSQCKEVFDFKSRLREHRPICSLNRYQCDICKKTYQTIRLLKRHLTTKHLNISKETEDIEQCYLGVESGIGSSEKQEKCDVQLNKRDRQRDHDFSKITPLTSNPQIYQNGLQNTTKLVINTTSQSACQPSAFNRDVDTRGGSFNNMLKVNDIITVGVKQHNSNRERDTNPGSSSNITSNENFSVHRNNMNLERGGVSTAVRRQSCQNEYLGRQYNKTTMCQMKNEMTRRSNKACVSHEDFDDLEVFDELDDVKDNLDLKSESVNCSWLNGQTVCPARQYNRTTVFREKHEIAKRTRIYDMNYQESDDSDDSDELIDYDSDDLDELENNRIGVSAEEHRMNKRSRTYVNYEESDENDDFEEVYDVSL